MIYNCHNCCKSISSKHEHCPFCKVDITEFSMLIEKKYKEQRVHRTNPVTHMLRGAFAGLKL